MFQDAKNQLQPAQLVPKNFVLCALNVPESRANLKEDKLTERETSRGRNRRKEAYRDSQRERKIQEIAVREIGIYRDRRKVRQYGQKVCNTPFQLPS